MLISFAVTGSDSWKRNSGPVAVYEPLSPLQPSITSQARARRSEKDALSLRDQKRVSIMLVLWNYTYQVQFAY